MNQSPFLFPISSGFEVLPGMLEFWGMSTVIRCWYLTSVDLRGSLVGKTCYTQDLLYSRVCVHVHVPHKINISMWMKLNIGNRGNQILQVVFTPHITLAVSCFVSGGYILECSQCLTSHLQRSARTLHCYLNVKFCGLQFRRTHLTFGPKTSSDQRGVSADLLWSKNVTWLTRGPQLTF